MSAGGGGKGQEVVVPKQSSVGDLVPLADIVPPLARWGGFDFYGRFYDTYKFARAQDGAEHDTAWSAAKELIFSDTDPLPDEQLSWISSLYRSTYESAEKHGRASKGYDIVPTRVNTAAGIPWANQVAPGVVVTGIGAFAAFGDKDVDADGKELLADVLKEHAYFWVDCEGNRRTRLLDQVAPDLHDTELSKQSSGEFSFVIKRSMQGNFWAHPAGDKGFVDSSALADQADWQQKTTDQLQLDIALCIQVLQEQLKNPGMVVCFQCAEGKDRSLHMAVLYSLVRKMFMEPSYRADLSGLVQHTWECRSRNALTSSGEHLPKLLLAYAADNERARELVSNGDQLQRAFFRAAPDEIFAAGAAQLYGFIRAELERHPELVNLQDPYSYPRSLINDVSRITPSGITGLHMAYSANRLSDLSHEVARDNAIDAIVVVSGADRENLRPLPLWEAFRRGFDWMHLSARGQQTHVNKQTLAHRDGIAIANDVRVGTEPVAGALPLYVTGNTAFKQGGDYPEANKAAARAFIEDGVSWVDCNGRRRGRGPRLLEAVYDVDGGADPEPADPAQPFAVVEVPVAGMPAESKLFAGGGPREFVSSRLGRVSGSSIEYSWDAWHQTARAQLDNFIDLALRLREQGKPIVFQCAEGKDRSVYGAGMYAALERMMLNPDSLLAVGEFAELIHRTRSNAALIGALYHPQVLLGYLDDKNRVMTFLREECRFAGETEVELLQAAQKRADVLVHKLLCEENTIFTDALETVQATLRAKMASIPKQARAQFDTLATGTQADEMAVGVGGMGGGGGSGRVEAAPPQVAASSTGPDDGREAGMPVRPIIMIDHGGVLDYEARAENPETHRAQLRRNGWSKAKIDEYVENKTLREADFRMPIAPNDGDIPVLPDGAEVVRLLNHLVTEHNAILVFHSKNKEVDQLRIIGLLNTAIDRYNADKEEAEQLVKPRFDAMVVADSTVYPDAEPDTAVVVNSRLHGIPVIGFAESGDDEGKRAVRQALESHFHIAPAARQFHYVLDDGGTNHRAAEANGYVSHRINHVKSPLQALQAIRDDLAAKKERGQLQIVCEQLDALLIQRAILQNQFREQIWRLQNLQPENSGLTFVPTPPPEATAEPRAQFISALECIEEEKQQIVWLQGLPGLIEELEAAAQEAAEAADQQTHNAGMTGGGDSGGQPVADLDGQPDTNPAEQARSPVIEPPMPTRCRVDFLDVLAFVITAIFSPILVPVVLSQLCKHNSRKQADDKSHAHLGDLLFRKCSKRNDDLEAGTGADTGLTG